MTRLSGFRLAVRRENYQSKLLENVERDRTEGLAEELGTQPENLADELDAIAAVSADVEQQAERAIVATRTQADDLEAARERADTLKRYAIPLGEILDGFETESEYEFVYSDAVDEPKNDDVGD